MYEDSDSMNDYIRKHMSTQRAEQAKQANIAGGLIQAPIHKQSQTSPFKPRQPEMNFNIIKAGGGWVIRVHNAYNSAGLMTEQELHVIPEDADFDKELGKIIMMVCLTQD